MALTRRQKQVYDFISRFVDKHGYSPSFDEIAEGLGLSSLATVHKHITNLEEKQLLRRDYNRSRSIDLLKPRGTHEAVAGRAAAAETNMTLPLLGRIAAGRPLEAVENPESISLADFTRSKDVYVLQVKGESMQDEHILDGDYVLVEKAEHGTRWRDRGGASRWHGRHAQAHLSRGREDPPAAFERRHAADHCSGRIGAGAGKSDWCAAEVLSSAQQPA